MSSATLILSGFTIVVCFLSVANAFSVTATGQWKPRIVSFEDRRLLRGLQHEAEKIGSIGFHHIEFYCGDAKSMAYRFSSALGMRIVGETGQMTGNDQCVSYGLESGEFRLLITAPYSQERAGSGAQQDRQDLAPHPLPSFELESAHRFFQKHGLAAKAIGILVKDARLAFEKSVQNGATPMQEPIFIPTCQGQKEKGIVLEGCHLAEVLLYGDVVLRYISYPTSETELTVPFLPHLSPTGGKIADRPTFGIRRIDHAVGNVGNLLEALTYVSSFTGFHEFAEFTADDVGTVESGLNSVVLASDSEDILLPLNEPTNGRRKSQIQTFLEQNEGAGLQHLALKTDDIFATIRKMRDAEERFAGFELMTRPSEQYYQELPGRLGDSLSSDQYSELQELGILADADDEGLLLQIFTKPIGDRPTFFCEIIQRVGCQFIEEGSSDVLERPGCGGFGKGNFRELFKAIEVSS